MKKNIIIIVVIFLVLIALGAYLYVTRGSSSSVSNIPGTMAQTGTLPAAIIPSGAETGPSLVIGTSQGSVSINNFYLTNPADGGDGTLIIKQTGDYMLTYNPRTSEFWIAITGMPFATQQIAAEQDFLATLGISKADACKLSVTSGIIYTPGNPLDGESFPLSFCVAGAFQGK